MQYVVCYDIGDDARRARVASALLDFGTRVQESVFLANLDEELASRMMERLKRLVSEDEDCVHVFAQCGTCAEKTQMLGAAHVPEERPFYVI